MGSVEWNKKEELVAEQALKHLKVSGVLASSPGLRGEGKGRPGDEASGVCIYHCLIQVISIALYTPLTMFVYTNTLT